MSKKQKQVEAQIQEEESTKQDEISEGVVAKDEQKQAQKSKEAKSADKKNDKKKDKKKKDKKKKDKSNGGIAKKTKETMSELKKVTWPSFGEVCKKTGIVIAFVLIFGLFLFGVNSLLVWLVSLLVG